MLLLRAVSLATTSVTVGNVPKVAAPEFFFDYETRTSSHNISPISTDLWTLVGACCHLDCAGLSRSIESTNSDVHTKLIPSHGAHTKITHCWDVYTNITPCQDVCNEIVFTMRSAPK